jgi:hypothetical protein
VPEGYEEAATATAPEISGLGDDAQPGLEVADRGAPLRWTYRSREQQEASLGG